MLPTTILLGLAFPIGLTLWAGDSPSEDTSRRAGTFYSLNVFGAILGSVLAGFVLLPQLGTRAEPDRRRGAGDAVERRCSRSRAEDQSGDARSRIAVASPVLFVIGARAAVDPFDVAFERFHRNETLVWREEGAQTTVAVHDRRGSPPMRVMFLDGNHQANDSPATRIRPSPHRRAAGDAASQSDHGAGGRPRRRRHAGRGGAPQRRTSTSSSSRAPSSTARTISRTSTSTCSTRPNVTLHVDDGRNFLLMNRKKYDVITADIILPRHAGAGSLYSREYYELVRNDAGRRRAGDAVEWRRLGHRIQAVDADVHVGVSVHHAVGRWQPDARQHEAVHAEPERLRGAPRRRSSSFRGTSPTLKRIYVAGPDEIAPSSATGRCSPTTSR